MFGLAHDSTEQLNQSPLLRSQKLRIADNVHEQHIGNLQLDLFVHFRWYLAKL